MNLARKLISLINEISEPEAVQDAVKEIQDHIKKGANVDTKHERELLIKFVSQKYGVDPNKVLPYIKIQSKSQNSNLDHIIMSAWKMALDRMPKPIYDQVKNLTVKIEDFDSEDPDLDGQTYPDNPPFKGFVMYRNGEEVSKGRISNIMQIMAHEAWHVFADKTNFYVKIGDILSGKIDHWIHYGIDDAKELLNFIELVENSLSKDFMRHLKQKIIDRPYWGEKYFLEQADIDEMKGILQKIHSRTFLGAMDELMAESLGRIVTGKSLFVPATLINFILKLA